MRHPRSGLWRSSTSGVNKEGLRYNVGFSALDQGGIIIGSNFQRYQGASKQAIRELTFTVIEHT